MRSWRSNGWRWCYWREGGRCNPADGVWIVYSPSLRRIVYRHVTKWNRRVVTNGGRDTKCALTEETALDLDLHVVISGTCTNEDRGHLTFSTRSDVATIQRLQTGNKQKAVEIR